MSICTARNSERIPILSDRTDFIITTCHVTREKMIQRGKFGSVQWTLSSLSIFVCETLSTVPTRLECRRAGESGIVNNRRLMGGPGRRQIAEETAAGTVPGTEQPIQYRILVEFIMV